MPEQEEATARRERNQANPEAHAFLKDIEAVFAKHKKSLGVDGTLYIVPYIESEGAEYLWEAVNTDLE
jgi:hypothetical protein